MTDIQIIPLVPCSIDGKSTISAVNARSLHAFLENRDHFATWIKDRIQKYDFSFGSDFHSFSEDSEKGRPSVEYYLTIEMAKELAMVERTAKGKEARQYFIECEKRLLAPQFNIPQTYSAALRLCADQQDQLEAQQLLIEQQKPAVEFLDRYVSARSDKGFREVAKILGIKERDFIKSLEADNIVFRQGPNLLPFAHYQHCGYFTVKTGETNGHAFMQTRFTPSGIAWVAKRFIK